MERGAMVVSYGPQRQKESDTTEATRHGYSTYSWFTMLCLFQVYSKAAQLYVHIYTHTHIYILFQILFHCRLLQDLGYSSLYYTVGPCLFHIQQSISALLSLQLFLSMLPVKNLKSMILPQVAVLSISKLLNLLHLKPKCDVFTSVFLQASFYTYSTVFNIVNGNASYVSVTKPRGHAVSQSFFWRFCVFVGIIFPG